MNQRNATLKAAAVVFASALAAGCAHTARKASPDAQKTALSPTLTASQAEPSMRDAAMIAIPEVKNVYFAFNSDHLTPEAEKTLRSNAAWLKEHSDVKVQVSGNCDQRGTVEYNLALGQRRAAAVRHYYKLMGVAGSRVATISYGKERPVCADATEACWQKNRRAETLEAVSQNVSSAALPPATR